MIVVFYGKRKSGKTTLCKHFFGWVKDNLPLKCHYLDADKIRQVYSLKEDTLETETKLVNKICDIANYEQTLNPIVLISTCFPLKSQRELINKNNRVLWIYLEHDEKIRFFKSFEEFEKPDEKGINTTDNSEEECLKIVIEKYLEFCKTKIKKPVLSNS